MKKLISLLLAPMMILSLAACGQSGAGDTSTENNGGTENEEAGNGTHIVVDHNGNEVKVPDEVERIVVCDILPLSSVLTVFFDSAEIIVGMSDTAMAAAKNGLLGEIYPEILNAKTDFIEGSTVNTEELMKLEPDVVIYNAVNKELGEQLLNAGFAAVAVSVNKWEYDCIETLNQWISILGEISSKDGKTEVVEKVEEKSKEMYDYVQEKISQIPEEERQRVLFLYKYSDTAIETSGKKFFGQWWADASGGINVGEEMTTDNSVVVNMEQIYDWNPDAIFITNFTSATPDDLYNNTVGNYNWSTVDAVKNQRVYKMPLGMYRSYTPGADTPVTLLWMAQTLYPDLFTDVDITQTAMDYYKDVFGVTLTKEQAASIFAPVKEAGAGF